MPESTSASDLRARLTGVMLHDEHALRRRIGGARKIASPERQRSVLATIERELSKAEARLARRAATHPTITYPAELPISARRDDLLATIGAHPVVIVSGETGSGKSTQLPKLCLELGRGVRGLIGHTQPRRIAARSIAERVASELDTTVGDLVGYAVRFTDRVGDDTFVKLMTDGILLAEISRDRLLTRYDTIIVDEAHERSLNIDFLLGYLQRLVRRRRDLKVIVTSATIDTERFSRHFDDAPIVEVSGRAHPVELRYRPIEIDNRTSPRDQAQAICDSARELSVDVPGDILVFCSGEREIRDTADALGALGLPGTSVLALFARLSSAEQHRVFERHSERRIVIATNVAETSLTVPGIRSVIDPGKARISRYSRRTKVQRLPIEKVSQASADQRAGRCGRIGPGVCIRLYSEDDYLTRPAFTEPEIQRTSLASVILLMADLGLGDVESFPFVDPPDTRNIRDGIALLEELGAVDPRQQGANDWLTGIGRQLARLPLDPRFGRMVIEADRRGCLREVTIIAAGLSIQDPRERPTDRQGAADEMHARFAHPDSDFLSIVALWEYVSAERRQRSSSQFRKLCQREYLNYARVREWQDVVVSLRQVAASLGFTENSRDSQPDQIHQAVLSGLLSHIGVREPRSPDFRGARSMSFRIVPGSVLFKQSPSWIMAADLTETTRLWARNIAGIRAEWAEQLGRHLVVRTYADPWWDATRGAAVTDERVTLYGVPVVSARRITYAPVDATAARDIFIRHALVDHEWETHHRFDQHNRDIVDEIRTLEARSRRGGILADEDARFEFFETRVPRDVTSMQDFDRWWKDHRGAEPNLLDLTREVLLKPEAEPIDPNAFPDRWAHGGLELPLSYEFEPDAPTDGIVVTVPLRALSQVDGAAFDWNVPGWREDLVVALVRSLPKQIRRELTPVAETVRAVLPRLSEPRGDLLDAVRRELSRVAGTVIPRDAFDLTRVPSYLRPTFRLVADDGEVVAEGPDLAAIAAVLDAEVRAAVAASGHALEQTGLVSWTIGTLPRVTETVASGHTIKAYPALVDEGDTVGVRLFPNAAEQAEAMWAGTRRLLRLQVPGPARQLQGLFTNDVALALTASPYASATECFHDCVVCALDEVMEDGGGPAWDESGFATLVEHTRGAMPSRLDEIGPQVTEILLRTASIRHHIERSPNVTLAPSVADIESHLDRLVYPGFIAGVGAGRLADVARYLRAIEHRLERLGPRVARDLELTARCQRLEAEYHALLGQHGWSAELEDIAWQLEEFRVSCFAQSIGTAAPVSEKRILTAMAAVIGTA